MGYIISIIGLITPGTAFVLAYLISFIAGIGSGLVLVSNQVILQIESDQDQVGRVFDIQSSLTNAVLIISQNN